jgi:hypothetical protein
VGIIDDRRPVRDRAVAVAVTTFLAVSLVATTATVARLVDHDRTAAAAEPVPQPGVTNPIDEASDPVDESLPIDSSAVPFGASETDSSVDNSGTLEPTGTASEFVESFSGAPGSPTAWSGAGWDVTVHDRDANQTLTPMMAQHGPTCTGPSESHQLVEYAQAVFQCRDHIMTAINSPGYGVIYLTPDRLVDFSSTEAVISVDVSTLRTSARDWWDIWISPYGDHLQLPLELDSGVDLTGPPRNGIRIGLGNENQMVAEIYRNHEPVRFPGWPNERVTGDQFTGYERFLTPDPARRDTFEIRISANHLKVGMPAYNFWWIDTPIPTLTWNTGVVQFGHHSYNPTKDCGTTNIPRPFTGTCTPNTWHWDNVRIDPAIPYTIIGTNRSRADATNPTITLDQPAPDNAMLRFAGLGNNLQIRYDNGPWQTPQKQATGRPTKEEHFTSYWTPIPPGTRTITYQATNWWGGPWQTRDTSVWAPRG